MILDTQITPLHRPTSRPTPVSIAKKGISHGVPFVSKYKTKVRAQPILSSSCPKLILQQLVAISGFDGQLPKRPLLSDFQEPNEVEQARYDADAVEAIRKNDLPKLRNLHKQGKNFNACSPFGETLLHMACRRGHVAVVEFLLQEARVQANVRCERGRTVFHDACWASVPNYDLMDVLLRFAPIELLLAQDFRGHTPFDYASRQNWGDWAKYLHKNKSSLMQRLQGRKEIHNANK